MSENYTAYETEEPSKLFLRPNSIIGNVDGFIRGLMESPGRNPQSSYNELVIYICSNNITFKWRLLIGRDNLGN